MAHNPEKEHQAKALIMFLLLVAAMLVLAWPVAGEGKVAFGLRPAQQGIGYFTYALEAGESISDEIVVANSGDVTVTLRIYALDAHSARNGGVIFPGGAGSTNTSAGDWLSLSVSQVTLEPGVSVMFPFTFTVPMNARVGEHVAGVIAENVQPITGTGDSVIQIIQRSALPIWETVPGPVVTSIQINSVEHVMRGGNSSFDVQLTNTGNVSLDAVVGVLQVTDSTNALVASVPVEVNGKFLAGDTIVYPANLDQPLPPGRYSVAVTTSYGGAPPIVWKSRFRVPGEFPEVYAIHLPLLVNGLQSPRPFSVCLPLAFNQHTRIH